MSPDDFWLTRIRDNRMRGLVAELATAIQDSDDAELLHFLRGTLRVGLTNLASSREEELRADARTKALSAMRRPARRLGR